MEPPLHPIHDIFLSHSGSQKGFVQDLHERLRCIGYRLFFDKNQDSLPLGQRFPDRIFSAAQTCKVAIVVLSHQFLTSRWPMIELCAFVERRQQQSDVPAVVDGSSPHSCFTILPLFYELSPGDIKSSDSEKAVEWRKAWEEFEEKDGKGRFSAAKCEEAVLKVLPALNGIERKDRAVEGETSYIKEVVEKIQGILRPRINFIDPGDGDQIWGTQRLSDIILAKFRELEAQPSSSTSNPNRNVHAHILGLHGVSGSGKSTLCKFLCDLMYDEFHGNVFYLELPTRLDRHHLSASADYQFMAQQYSKLLPKTLPRYTNADLDQVIASLTLAKHSHKMFLVLDNLSPSNREIYVKMLRNILKSHNIVLPGSRIVVVAQTDAMLEDMSHEIKRYSMYAWDITEIPPLTESEAMQIIRNGYPSLNDHQMTPVLREAFHFRSSLYIPFVLEQIGVLLRDNCDSVAEEPERQMERLFNIVSEGKKDIVHRLVDKNFNNLREELQVLLSDIALFIIPAGYSDLEDAIPILSGMQDTIRTFDAMRMKISELRKRCSLTIVGNRWLQIHDIFSVYLESTPQNSKSYINQSWSRILTDDLLSPPGPVRVRLKCPEARTVKIGSRMESIHNGYHEVPIMEAHRLLHLDLEIRAKAKALIVWPWCDGRDDFGKYNLCLSGDLSSLVCVEVKNVQQVSISPSAEGARGTDLSNLSRLELIMTDRNDPEIASHNSSSFLGRSIDYYFKQSMRWLFNPSILPWQQCPLTLNGAVSSLVRSGRTTRLRALTLANCGIRRLEDIGRICPHLEKLQVNEEGDELMFVSIGKATKLKTLIIGGGHPFSGLDSWLTFGTPRGNAHPALPDPRRRSSPPESSKLVLQLQECPELRELFADVSYFDHVEVMGQLPPKLLHFGLANHRSIEVLPTRLMLPNGTPLSQLQTLHLICDKVERLYFEVRCLGHLPLLKGIRLTNCTSLTHVSIGESCLPNLEELRVEKCNKLQSFEGVENVLKEKLEDLVLQGLPELECGVRLVGRQLERIVVSSCPRVMISNHMLQPCVGLKHVCLRLVCVVTVQKSEMHAGDAIMFMGNSLQNVDWMRLEGTYLCYPRRLDEDDIQSSSVHNMHVDGSMAVVVLQPLKRLTFSKGQFSCLRHLSLFHVKIVGEIGGIQHLPMLEELWIRLLPDLVRIVGMWPSKVQRIELDDCPILEEIPDLDLDNSLELHFLIIVRCSQLRAVNGCFRRLSSLTNVQIERCESMESFPMEDRIDELCQLSRREDGIDRWGQGITKVRSLSVVGSKFASVGRMWRWLRDARPGSVLLEAAKYALLWEYVRMEFPDIFEDMLSREDGNRWRFADMRDHFGNYVRKYLPNNAELQHLPELFDESRDAETLSFLEKWIERDDQKLPEERSSTEPPYACNCVQEGCLSFMSSSLNNFWMYCTPF